MSEDVKQLEVRVHEAMGTSPDQGHVSFVELHVSPADSDICSNKHLLLQEHSRLAYATSHANSRSSAAVSGFQMKHC